MRWALWLFSLMIAAGLGWAAAMAVNAGDPIGDEEEAYARFSNALTHVDSFERTETLLKLAKQLTPETLPGAIRAYRQDPGKLAPIDVRILMWVWANEDPFGMVEEVKSWPDLRSQRLASAEAVSRVAHNLGYDAARELYDSLPSHTRDRALPSLVVATLDLNLIGEIYGLIDSYPVGDDRDIVAGIAARQMMERHGPGVVQEWVESLPAGRGSKRDVKRVAFRAAQDAHLDAGHFESLEKWVDRVGEEEWAVNARRGIALHWVKREPIEAIAWARALSVAQDRDEIVAEAVRVFATLDAVHALGWIRSEEPAAELDRGTGRLAIYFARRDPEVAFEMARRIVTDKTFQNVRSNLKKEWHQLGNPEKREALMSRVEAIGVERAAASASDDGPTGSVEEG